MIGEAIESALAQPVPLEVSAKNVTRAGAGELVGRFYDENPFPVADQHEAKTGRSRLERPVPDGE